VQGRYTMSAPVFVIQLHACAISIKILVVITREDSSFAS
jgi:hypothetical protein